MSYLNRMFELRGTTLLIRKDSHTAVFEIGEPVIEIEELNRDIVWLDELDEANMDRSEYVRFKKGYRLHTKNYIVYLLFDAETYRDGQLIHRLKVYILRHYKPLRSLSGFLAIHDKK